MHTLDVKPLRALLQDMGVQQTQLAEAMELPKQTLNNYITGRRKVPLSLAIRIAQYLGRPVESIVFPVADTGRSA